MDHHDDGVAGDVAVGRYTARDVHDHGSAGPPYEIRHDEVVGRHMVASRDIKPGEIIFKERPLTFGPSENTKPVCLGCYRRIRRAGGYACSKCGFPMCSKECEVIPEHRDAECAAFRSHGFKLDQYKIVFDGVEGDSHYEVISPIRALRIQDSGDREKWDLVWGHMSHDKRRAKSDYWRDKTKKVIRAMKDMIGLEDGMVRTVEIILGILLVNDFEIGIPDETEDTDSNGIRNSSEASVRGLFGLASMPSHSCVANATHDFADRKSGGFAMTMRATVKIPAGADITHSYTEPLDPVLYRMGLLKVGKFFHCGCPRCTDPTELGTFSSAIKCKDCENGTVISTDPADIEADWRCNNGGCESGPVKCDDVQKAYQKIKAESEKLEPGKISKAGGTVEEYEGFLKKYSSVLHPNHVILVDKKYTLAKMYGRVSGYEADQMSEVQLRRKMELCKEVLVVLDKIMPGRTRKRGMIMYELHLPLVLLANRALQRGPKESGMEPKQIKEYLKLGLFNLRMGLEILKDEPEGSFENKIVVGSAECVKQLEQWIKTVSSSI